MKKVFILLMAAVVSVILAACGETNTEPREIDEETDICVVCNMSITHPNYAGQLIFENNDHLVFDDIGCLIEYLKEPEQDVAIAYIRAADTKEWIDVETAAYLYNEEYWTPMNYGVLAFASEEDAKKYAELNGAGENLSYDDLMTSFNWGVHVH